MSLKTLSNRLIKSVRWLGVTVRFAHQGHARMVRSIRQPSAAIVRDCKQGLTTVSMPS